MKKLSSNILGSTVYVFTVLIISGIALSFWVLNEYRAPGPLPQETLIDIPSGASNNEIARILVKNGAFDDERDALIFKIAARATGAASMLKAGEYKLPSAISIRDTLSQLKAGETFARRVTLREGLTSYEIVQRLSSVEELSGNIKSLPAEGTLLPQTYDYRLGEDRNALIKRMQTAMKNVQADLWSKRAQNLPFKTLAEAMTLASIVEKETGVAGERTRVAGVFINRLRRGMPLQTDPTVIYAITKGKHKNDGQGPLGRRLLRKDMAVDSPYNTYKNAGLPPGPIASPGRASIEAVLNPESHNYIYFVADGSGGHIFAKTLSEHNANAAEWRKIRRTAK